MATAITTIAGHVARAVRFYNETEIFAGIGVGDPWANESAPPTVDTAALNLGRIHTVSYSGASFTNLNTVLTFNNTSFVGGSIEYKIVALSASTYEVRKVSDNSVVTGTDTLTSWSAQSAARTTIIPGLSIKVTNTSMTTGHYCLFTADGAIGFKLVAEKRLVIPDVSGTIAYRGQNWLIVDPAEALTKGARHVYIQVTFEYDELPLTDFRQLGIFTGLTRVSGNATVLLPNQVASVGFLELLDNRTVITRELEQREAFSFIIEH